MCILSQIANTTRNEAEFNRSKISRKTKMTIISQKQTINILKLFFFLSADKGSLSCFLIGHFKPYFRTFCVFLKFFKSLLCILSFCDVLPVW